MFCSRKVVEVTPSEPGVQSEISLLVRAVNVRTIRNVVYVT